jgi:hypothetical protein
MRQLIAGLCAALCLAVISSQSLAYDGPDAGVLVMSIGYREPKTDFYDIFYSGPETPNGLISIHARADLFRRIDFRGQDTGTVVTVHLKPGDYGIYKIEASEYEGVRDTSARRFWVPFTIRNGQTTYIGSYIGVLIPGTEERIFAGPAPIGVYFLVSDKHDRDIDVASKREHNLPPVTLAVPEASSLPKPYFQSGE